MVFFIWNWILRRKQTTLSFSTCGFCGYSRYNRPYDSLYSQYPHSGLKSNVVFSLKFRLKLNRPLYDWWWWLMINWKSSSDYKHHPCNVCLSIRPITPPNIIISKISPYSNVLCTASRICWPLTNEQNRNPTSWRSMSTGSKQCTSSCKMFTTKNNHRSLSSSMSKTLFETLMYGSLIVAEVYALVAVVSANSWWFSKNTTNIL